MQEEERGFSPRTWLTTLSAGGWIILVNVVLLLAWQIPAIDAFLRANFMVSAEAVTSGRVWTLLTFAVSHIEPFHLLFNVLFVFLFARDLQAIYGGKNLLVLYAFGAIVSGLAHVGITVAAGTPGVRALGASGSVMALVVALTLIAPHRRLNLLGVMPIPLWGLALAFVVMDLLGVANEVEGQPGGVAHAAHLGGAVAGAAFKLLDLRLFAHGEAGPGLLDRLRRPRPRRRAPQLRVLPPLPQTDDVEPEDAGIDADTSERVDELLRKINKEGIGALSAEERRFLEEASRRYQKSSKS